MEMGKQIPGVHHITALAGDPQQNIDFYTQVLGLRLVKLTVNFDDPGAYHLYFGDEVGHPGTILTFFSWPGAQRGRRGAGQLTSTAFSIPELSLDYWLDRLQNQGVAVEGPTARFNDQVLTFEDPDGLLLELVARPDVELREGWKDGPVPSEHAIRAFNGITLIERNQERTAATLNALGFKPVGQEGNRFRYQAGEGSEGAIVDVLEAPDERLGIVSVGTVHHVAWRTPSDEQQLEWREELIELGHNVTPVMDRQYFHSIYFREPGGVLFEIATDPPGFTLDETPEELGTHLKLPPWFEPMRARIEQSLPPMKLPGSHTADAAKVR
jgi:glyoxalase family protein